ncbi:unnamed protein product [Litomosoides sigmodontis]|uniref:Uncharacterized protein n=1 Tax=Litomosoides sigmodontis TaxID=42156 RepID=A0A3P6UT47_LITSI|nr:unnamed protein product [Litomosoides sigmodontis]
MGNSEAIIIWKINLQAVVHSLPLTTILVDGLVDSCNIMGREAIAREFTTTTTLKLASIIDNNLNYKRMSDLKTNNDQRGKVAVGCIFEPTRREIYGQRAVDMIEQLAVRSEYGIENDHSQR